MMYIQCQRSVPMQEVVCHSCTKAENNGVDLGVVDGSIVCQGISNHQQLLQIKQPNRLFDLALQNDQGSIF